MSALFKLAVYVVFLLSALAISLHFLEWLSPENVASAPAKPEAAAAPVDPAGTAGIDEELDYWAAQKVGSLDGWRSFLAAHGSGVYAQAARTEMQKLLPAEKASAPAKREAAAAPVDPAGTAGIDEELDYWAAQKVGSLDGWRSFLAAHGSGVYAQAARTEMQKLLPAEKASAPAKREAAAAPVDPAGTAGIDEELDYWAAQKVGSLDGWRSFLAAHGSGVYAQAARTEMQKLLPAEKASAPAKREAAAAPVDPAGTAGIDEELDYWAAQKVGSLDGWRSFLAAHGSGVYAQAARTEMQKLLPAEKASAPAKPEAAAAPVDPAGTAAIEEELDYWAAQKVGSLDGWRSFLAAHGSGVYAQAARTEMQKLLPAEKASAPAKREAAAAPVDPAGTAAIDEELDYWAAQKVGSLDGWRSFLAAHGSGVYAQAARTEMQKLLPGEKASAPAKPEAAAAPVDPVG